MKTFLLASFASALVIFSATAQTTAVGKYRTGETFEKAFLTSLRTVPLSEFTVKSSDKAQGTIQANRMDKLGRKEFASLFILVTKETTNVLIEATFTRNSGFMGGGKPVDWVKTFGDKMKVELPDLKVEVTDVGKK
jgi:hypothetical protein